MAYPYVVLGLQYMIVLDSGDNDMYDMVELIVNGKFVGVFSSSLYAKQWAKDNKDAATYTIVPLGTTIPLYMRPDRKLNHIPFSDSSHRDVE